jgi:hypothetical protein
MDVTHPSLGATFSAEWGDIERAGATSSAPRGDIQRAGATSSAPRGDIQRAGATSSAPRGDIQRAGATSSASLAPQGATSSADRGDIASLTRVERNNNLHYNSKGGDRARDPLPAAPDVTPPPPTADGGSTSQHSPSPVFRALVCWILGWEEQTLPTDRRAQLTETVDALARAGYSEQDLRAFWDRIWRRDWRYKRDRSHPTLNQLRAEIGKLRLSEKPPGTHISNVIQRVFTPEEEALAEQIRLTKLHGRSNFTAQPEPPPVEEPASPPAEPYTGLRKVPMPAQLEREYFGANGRWKGPPASVGGTAAPAQSGARADFASFTETAFNPIREAAQRGEPEAPSAADPGL